LPEVRKAMESYRQFKEALEYQLVELEKFPDLKGPNLAQLIKQAAGKSL